MCFPQRSLRTSSKPRRTIGTIRGIIASSAKYAQSALSSAATEIAGRSATVQSGTGHPTLAVAYEMEILLIKGAKYVESSLHPPGSRSSLDVEEVVQHERVSAPATSVFLVGGVATPAAPPEPVRAAAWLTEAMGGASGVERCASARADAGERRAAMAGGERLQRRGRYGCARGPQDRYRLQPFRVAHTDAPRCARQHGSRRVV